MRVDVYYGVRVDHRCLIGPNNSSPILVIINMTTIGFGIVGCGVIADFHARAIADAAGTHLVGCSGGSRFGKVRSFADTHGCRAFESLDAMLADPNVEAVTICSPSGAHLDPALAAARAGKHVVVEKPLEITVERCDEITRACQTAGVKLGVVFQSRFHESVQLMKDAVDAQRFGHITLGDAYVKWYRSQEYYDSGQWRGTWELDGGGALMNQAIHSVDLLLWLMGPVRRVSAMTATLTHQRIEVEDVAVANVEFVSGALGVIEATTTAFPGSLKRIEIRGSQGTAVLEEEDIKMWSFADETESDVTLRRRMESKTDTGGGAADPAAIGHRGHRAVFEDFATAVRLDRSPMVDGQQGRRSVELIRAIYESAEKSIPVSLV